MPTGLLRARGPRAHRLVPSPNGLLPRPGALEARVGWGAAPKLAAPARLSLGDHTNASLPGRSPVLTPTLGHRGAQHSCHPTGPGLCPQTTEGPTTASGTDPRVLVCGQIRASGVAARAGDVAPDPHHPHRGHRNTQEPGKAPRLLSTELPASQSLLERTRREEIEQIQPSTPSSWGNGAPGPWGEWGHWGGGQRAAASWLVRAPSLPGSAAPRTCWGDPSTQAGPELLPLSMAGPRDTSDWWALTWGSTCPHPCRQGPARYLWCPHPLWWCECCQMTPGETQGGGRSERGCPAQPTGPGDRGTWEVPSQDPRTHRELELRRAPGSSFSHPRGQQACWVGRPCVSG